MGIFTHPIEIAARPDGPFQQLEAVVDTGAFYAQAPASLLRRLGVEPFDRATFELADGRRVESDLGEVTIRIDERTRRTLCVFGEEGSAVILGAYTLEGFMLAADPVHKRLIPVVGYRL